MVTRGFWENVGPADSNGCMVWLRAKRLGYGLVSVRRRLRSAHRVAWELANGQPIPAGLIVMHACDNPSCCNPAHLRLGTRGENTRDCVAKGRLSNRKLDPSSVREIRARHACGESLASLAAVFRVTETSVENVTARRTWRSVN